MKHVLTLIEITENGYDHAVYLDGHCVLSADPSAGEDVGSVKEVAGALSAVLKTELDHIEYPAGQDWQWDDIILHLSEDGWIVDKEKAAEPVTAKTIPLLNPSEVATIAGALRVWGFLAEEGNLNFLTEGTKIGEHKVMFGEEVFRLGSRFNQSCYKRGMQIETRGLATIVAALHNWKILVDKDNLKQYAFDFANEHQDLLFGYDTDQVMLKLRALL